jgi:hypothetical protein
MVLAQVVVSEAVTELVNMVAERWGYYFGKRAIQSDVMKATTAERAKIRALGQQISAKIGEYLANGIDVREEVRALQGSLTEARIALKEKSAPLYMKIKPLNLALTYLDKLAIPKAIESATGSAVLPRFEVSDAIVKAITKPAKK